MRTCTVITFTSLSIYVLVIIKRYYIFSWKYFKLYILISQVLTFVALRRVFKISFVSNQSSYEIWKGYKCKTRSLFFFCQLFKMFFKKIFWTVFISKFFNYIKMIVILDDVIIFDMNLNSNCTKSQHYIVRFIFNFYIFNFHRKNTSYIF